jgi:formate dehydrogenase alpha subunit
VGNARADWDILADLYQRLVPRAAGEVGLQQLMEEIKSVAPLYREVSFDQRGGCKPCVKPLSTPKSQSLKFVPVSGGKAESSKGMQLLSGKILFHFGTTSTFSESPLEVAPEGYIEINPQDAQKLGVSDGGALRVKSSVGTAQGKVRISDSVPEGLLFAPYHFSDLNINQVLPAATNSTAVEVSKA